MEGERERDLGGDGRRWGWRGGRTTGSLVSGLTRRTAGAGCGCEEETGAVGTRGGGAVGTKSSQVGFSEDRIGG